MKVKEKSGGLRTMKALASRAVAVLCIQRLIAVELVFDAAAVAAPFVLGLKGIIVLVDPVGCARLPVVGIRTHRVGTDDRRSG